MTPLSREAEDKLPLVVQGVRAFLKEEKRLTDETELNRPHH